MSAAHIFLNGAYRPEESGFYKSFLTSGDLVIAADAAVVILNAWGIVPNLLVGDLDSLPANYEIKTCKIKAREIKKAPAEKDYTDGEIALQEALAQAPAEINFYGFLPREEEVDHFYGNLELLAKASLEGIRAVARSPRMDIYLLTEKLPEIRFTASIGDIVSLAPYCCSAAGGVTAQGLKWPLCLENITPDGKYLRNQAAEENIHISRQQGMLAVFHGKERQLAITGVP